MLILSCVSQLNKSSTSWGLFICSVFELIGFKKKKTSQDRFNLMFQYNQFIAVPLLKGPVLPFISSRSNGWETCGSCFVHGSGARSVLLILRIKQMFSVVRPQRAWWQWRCCQLFLVQLHAEENKSLLQKEWEMSEQTVNNFSPRWRGGNRIQEIRVI